MLSRLTSKTWDPIILIFTIVALGARACVMAVGNGGGARRLFVTLKDGKIVRSCNHWRNTSPPIPHRVPVRKLHISLSHTLAFRDRPHEFSASRRYMYVSGTNQISRKGDQWENLPSLGVANGHADCWHSCSGVSKYVNDSM